MTAGETSRQDDRQLPMRTSEVLLWGWVAVATAAYLWQFRDIMPAAVRILLP